MVLFQYLWRFAQNMITKLVLLFFLINFRHQTIIKTILWSYLLQICANLLKSRNNTMSNDGSIIENMDLSHIHLAVQKSCNTFRLFWNEFTKILSNSKIVYACLKKSAKNYNLTQVIQRSTTMSQRKSQSSWDWVSNNGLKFFLLKTQMYNNDNASSKITSTHCVKWREASNGQLS
jgi:hypothetical protein